jgi:hypothetical protein
MVKIPKQGDYVSSEDVRDGDVVVIVGEPELRSAEDTGFDRDVWAVKVLLPNGIGKQWTLNKTTYNDLWSAFGDESRDWLNRKVRITTETRKVRGEKRTIIFGEPIVESDPSPRQAKIDLANLTQEQREQLRRELNKDQTGAGA